MSLLVPLLVSFKVAMVFSTNCGDGDVVEVRHFGSEAVIGLPFLISVCSDILNCYWNVIVTGIILVIGL